MRYLNILRNRLLPWLSLPALPGAARSGFLHPHLCILLQCAASGKICIGKTSCIVSSHCYYSGCSWRNGKCITAHRVLKKLCPDSKHSDSEATSDKFPSQLFSESTQSARLHCQYKNRWDEIKINLLIGLIWTWFAIVKQDFCSPDSKSLRSEPFGNWPYTNPWRPDHRNIHLIYIRFPELYIQSRFSLLHSQLYSLLFPLFLTCRKYALRMFPRFRSQHRSHFSSNSTYHPDIVPTEKFLHVFIITRGKLL